ncbi:MAG: cysteine protease, partial [Brevundimonas sp.]
VLGGLLMSRGGRRLAGRHAGKLALATLAWQLYQQHRSGGPTAPGGAKPRPSAAGRRWSGRTPTA